MPLRPLARRGAPPESRSSMHARPLVIQTARRLLLLAAFLAPLLTAHAQPRAIGVNVTAHNAIGSMRPADAAGAVHRAGNWNNLTPPFASTSANPVDTTYNAALLKWVYDDGSPISKSEHGSFQVVSDFPRFFGEDAGNADDAALFSGLSELTAAQPVTVALYNIPFARYDVYVYATRGPGYTDGRWGGAVALGKETLYIRAGKETVTRPADYVRATTTRFGGAPADYLDIAGGNYAVFENLSGGSQTITLSALNLGYGLNADGTPGNATLRFNIYGIQIVRRD